MKFKYPRESDIDKKHQETPRHNQDTTKKGPRITKLLFFKVAKTFRPRLGMSRSHGILSGKL